MKSVIIIVSLVFISSFPMSGQDNLKMELKDDLKPHLYIDGKKYDHDIFDLLDQSKIATVNVIKDDQAHIKYNAPNGVILVTTKKAAAERIVEVDKKEIRINSSDKDPLIVIDGEISDRATLSKLSPDDIATIDVIKGEKAMEQYEAPYGVVVVKTKKK